MSTRIEYKEGDKIGSCTYLKELEPKLSSNNKRMHRRALFLCSCGKEFESRIDRIKREEARSCGCLRDMKIKQQGFNNRKHGQSYHPIFPVWNGMKHRCERTDDIGYHLYGGRGIKICDRWQDVNNFIEDMYPSYREGLEIDRIDNNGNYEPSNCRWVTDKENSNNRRSNKIVEYNNEKRNIAQWAELLNIPYWRLQHRLIIMPVNEAFEYCLSYK